MKKVLFVLLALLTVLFVTVSCDATLDADAFNPEPTPTPSAKYLKFSNEKNEFKISAIEGWNGTIEYSTDAINWTVWNGTEITSGTSGDTYVLYLRGKGNTIIAGESKAIYSAFTISSATPGTVNISGNLGYLLDYDNPDGVEMQEGCFAAMFYNCTALGDLSELTLPNCTPSVNCYLWNQSNDSILGKPVVICNEMPDAQSGKKPILFGDLSYYWVIDRKPASVKTLRELFATKGQVGYIVQERLDAKLVRSEAVKVLAISSNQG